MTDATQPLTFGSAMFDAVRLDAVVLPAVVYASWNLYPDRRLLPFWFAAGTAFLMLVMVAALVSPGPDWLRAMLLLCFPVLAVFFLASLMMEWRDVRRVSLSRQGVHFGPASSAFVPWSAIERTGVQKWWLFTTTFLQLRDPAAVGAPIWFVPGLGRSAGRVGIDTGSRARTLEVARLIDYYLDHPEERELVGVVAPAALDEPTTKRRPAWRRAAGFVLWLAWLALAILFLVLIGAGLLDRLLPS